MSIDSPKTVIGFDVAQTCASREGCAWHADALARALSKTNGPFTISLYHHFVPWINQTCVNGTQIEGISAPFFHKTHEEAQSIWQNVIEQNSSLPDSPNLLHSNSFSVPPKPKGTKLLYTIHDLCFWTHPHFVVERNRLHCQSQLLQALKHADAFIFISHCAHKDFENLFPNWLVNHKRHWKVIHSGCRFPALDCLPELEPHILASSPWLYVGSIEPRKNVIGLLKAYEAYYKTSKTQRPLVISGSPKDHSYAEVEALTEAAKTLPIKQLGYVSDSELKKLYQTSFALLFPSHYEGFGLPVIEAMGAGLPVICQDIPSIKEFTHESVRTVSFDDPTVPAQAMIDLEANIEAYQALRNKGWQTAKSYTWEKTARETVEFYDEVLSDPN